MASTSEVGHAKNVANFQDLIEFVTGYGSAYDPSKASLTLPALVTLKTTADANLADVIAKNTNYNNKINDRMTAFSDLKTLSTRLINALQATDATTETIADAKTFNRKIQGKRASGPQVPLDPTTPPPTTISSSQQSYDQLIQHFTGLKSVLEEEPTYTPNESALRITTLSDKIVDLNAKNTAVATAYTSVSNSRIGRNATLYTDNTGLVEVALEVKKYIKSVFGASSPQYAQVSGLKFKTPASV